MYGYSQMLQPTDLTLEDLLEKVTEEDIFGIFIKEPINTEDRYCAPYRKDDNPDCYFSYKDDRLLFVDFASGDLIPNVTCIGMVMKCLNLTYGEAISYVEKYFNLESVIKPHDNVLHTNLKEKNRPKYYPINIEISKRDFNLWDKKFWYKYGITRQQLIQDKIFPITAYRSNTRLGKTYTITTNDIAYAFTDFDNGHIKIYRPYNESSKWFTNCNQNDIGCIKFIADVEELVITKSYKDCRVLRNLGINSIWFQNEGMSPSAGILKNLTERFKNIYILFDNDPAGIAASLKIKNLLNSIKPNISQEVFLPPILYKEEGIKDPSDFIVSKGKEELINFIKSKNINMYESLR